MELKDQLEDIQRRVEDEIQAGVPPVRLTVTNMQMLQLPCLNFVHSKAVTETYEIIITTKASSKFDPSSPYHPREAVCWLLLS